MDKKQAPSAATKAEPCEEPKSGKSADTVKPADTGKTVAGKPIDAPVKVSKSGDKGNPHYAAELDAFTSVSKENVSSSNVSSTGNVPKETAEPAVKMSVAKPTGDRGNPHYAAELDALATNISKEAVSSSKAPSTGIVPMANIEPAVKMSVAKPTGDRGNPHYAAELDALASNISKETISSTKAPSTGNVPAEKIEPPVKMSMAKPTGDRGNPHYAAELDALATNLSKETVSSSKAHSTGTVPAETIEAPVKVSVAHPTGGRGNPHYAAELDRLETKDKAKSDATQKIGEEKSISSSALSSIEAQLLDAKSKSDSSAVSASMLASIEAQMLDSKSTQQESKPKAARDEKVKSSGEKTIKATTVSAVEAQLLSAQPKKQEVAKVKSEKAPTTGGKGNLHYAAEIEASAPIKSSQIQKTEAPVSGAKTSPETSIKVEQKHATGGKGNLHYAAEIEASAPIKSTQIHKTAAPVSGAKTSPDAGIKVEQKHATGGKGNLHYAEEIEASAPIKSTQIHKTAAPVSGGKTSSVGAVKAEKSFPTGNKGNPHYAKELEAAKPGGTDVDGVTVQTGEEDQSWFKKCAIL